MKRQGNLIEKIADRDNLTRAFLRAKKGKSRRAEVKSFEKNLEENLSLIREQILDGPLELGAYRVFWVRDPKKRLISSVPFSDRVFHHAIINICHHSFDSFQIFDSYACRNGKGIYKAIDRAQVFSRKFDFYLKLDIKSYFASISHDVLFSHLCRRFKDHRLLEIFKAIIDGYEIGAGRGIPIGNLTSQYFANHYLGIFDHYLKEVLKCSAYVRYMDDFVLWGNKRSILCEYQNKTSEFLADILQLDVKLKGFNRVGSGMTFLGYKVFPSKITLARRSRIRFQRKMAHILEVVRNGQWSEQEGALHAEPLLAFVRHAQSAGLRRRCLEQV